MNELKDTEKNNPSEKVANYRPDSGKGTVPTLVWGTNRTAPPTPSGQEG